jgi:hypothetical protein
MSASRSLVSADGRQVELFNNIINIMQKYKILDGLGAGIYDELHKLRRYRNKVHIQTDVDVKGVPRDEDKAFSKETLAWSLEFAVRVLQHLGEKFPRPKELEQFAHELKIREALKTILPASFRM